MDAPYTVPEAARTLRTSAPRIHRAIAAGIIHPAFRNRTALLTRADVEALRSRWGVAAEVDGLSREEVFILAALSRRPFGLAGPRAIARAARISPTTAAEHLRRLGATGLVTRRHHRVAAGGVVELETWTIAWTDPAWSAVSERVRRTTLPKEPAVANDRPARRPAYLPKRFGHIFWDVAATGKPIPIQRYAASVGARLLVSRDLGALAWLSLAFTPDQIEQALTQRGITDQDRALARALVPAGTRGRPRLA